MSRFIRIDANRVINLDHVVRAERLENAITIIYLTGTTHTFMGENVTALWDRLCKEARLDDLRVDKEEV